MPTEDTSTFTIDAKIARVMDRRLVQKGDVETTRAGRRRCARRAGFRSHRRRGLRVVAALRFD